MSEISYEEEVLSDSDVWGIEPETIEIEQYNGDSKPDEELGIQSLQDAIINPDVDLDPIVQERLEEYYKCKNDYLYFFKHYIYLELPGGNQLMNPYRKQTDLIKLIHDEKYVLVLKSRQIGISTVIQAYIVWLFIFFRNVVVGVISKNGAEATDFNRFILSMIDNLPGWLKPKFVKRAEQSFILDNGCKCYASTVNPSNPEKTLRGKAVTFLIIDEAAFVSYIDKAYSGIVSALSTNQMHARKANVPFGTVICSTPNKTTGIGKWYFERYQTSISGTDIFKPFRIHWREVDELANDPHWYKSQCELSGNDTNLIEQELELKFLPAEGGFLPEATCIALQNSADKHEPIEILKLFNGEAWVFQKPFQGVHYIIGVDTATEYGLDKSAIVVLNYKTLEQVWEYQGKLSVTDFCRVVHSVANLYRGTIVIERNSVGNQVMETLIRTHLSGMVYSERRKDKITGGLNVDTLTRPLIGEALYTYITQFPETVRSKRLVTELIGLVRKSNGRIEADRGAHDDVALAYSFCAYVRKYDPVLEVVDEYNGDLSNFSEVVEYNLPVTKITNANIRKMIKESPDDFNGWIDVLQYYKE
jgi:hypothetical protein